MCWEVMSRAPTAEGYRKKRMIDIVIGNILQEIGDHSWGDFAATKDLAARTSRVCPGVSCSHRALGASLLAVLGRLLLVLTQSLLESCGFDVDVA
jgi:hypothetical protein